MTVLFEGADSHYRSDLFVRLDHILDCILPDHIRLGCIHPVDDSLGSEVSVVAVVSAVFDVVVVVVVSVFEAVVAVEEVALEHHVVVENTAVSLHSDSSVPFDYSIRSQPDHSSHSVHLWVPSDILLPL